ncbi:MAG: hypothetical protein RSA02_02320 [Bacteroidales bacterium]
MFFVWILNSILRHFVLFLILFALSISIVFFLRHQNHTYEGECSFNCNGFDNLLLDTEISKLDHLIQNHNTLVLSSMLQLPQESVKKITSIHMGIGIDTDGDLVANEITYKKKYRANLYEEIKGKSKDMEEKFFQKPLRVRLPNTGYLYITTSTNNANEFNTITQSIIKYINKNSFLTACFQSHININLLLLQEYAKQIQMLDSLQIIEYIENSRRAQPTGSTIIYTANADNKGKQLFHADILALNEKENNIHSDLAINKSPITILSNFYPISRQLSFATYPLMLLFSLLIGLLLCLIMDHHKAIIQYIQKQQK